MIANHNFAATGVTMRVLELNVEARSMAAVDALALLDFLWPPESMGCGCYLRAVVVDTERILVQIAVCAMVSGFLNGQPEYIWRQPADPQSGFSPIQQRGTDPGRVCAVFRSLSSVITPFQLIRTSRIHSRCKDRFIIHFSIYLLNNGYRASIRSPIRKSKTFASSNASIVINLRRIFAPVMLVADP